MPLVGQVDYRFSQMLKTLSDTCSGRKEAVTLSVFHSRVNNYCVTFALPIIVSRMRLNLVRTLIIFLAYTESTVKAQFLV